MTVEELIDKCLDLFGRDDREHAQALAESLLVRRIEGAGNQSITRNFGSIPTDKLEIEVLNGRVHEIKMTSGLNWSPRGGYGTPRIHAKVERETALS